MAAPRTAMKRHAVVGVFDDADAGERAYRACVERGYDIDQVNVIVSEGTRSKLLQDGDEAKAELVGREAEGGELGGPEGGRVGLLVAVFAAVGAAAVIPAVGFAAAGPVTVALAAAGTAGAAGGLIAAISDWGMPDEQSRAYQSDVREGAILMMLRARSNADARAIAREWEELGGRRIHAS